MAEEKFKLADEEFRSIAKQLFDAHKEDQGLTVDPSDKVIFARSDAKQKSTTSIKYAYCRMIHDELSS